MKVKVVHSPLNRYILVVLWLIFLSTITISTSVAQSDVSNVNQNSEHNRTTIKKNFNTKSSSKSEGKTELTTPSPIRRHPPLESVRAPFPGQYVSIPGIGISLPSIQDALKQPLSLGSEMEGFVPPDWTQPFRDIKADRMRRDFNKDLTILEGNVHLRLGELLFQSDHFIYGEKIDVIEATGNVTITQRDAILRAQKIMYTSPEEEELLTKSPIFKPVISEEELAKKRLTLGRIYAESLTIKDPIRDFKTEKVDYNFLTKTGYMEDVRGVLGPFYFYAKKLTLRGENNFEADDVWLTTCDHDPPHYRVKVNRIEIEENKLKSAEFLRLQVGNVTTPLFVPFWGKGIDLDVGREPVIGSYINVGYMFAPYENFRLGPRIMITENEGVGLGGDIEYDFMEDPTSPFFRTRGDIHGLYTTEERGYIHLYHRFEPSDDLVILGQLEHWSDEEFYKDFFYKTYRNRTEPRSFITTTYRESNYIASATARVSTHGWVHETERLPEATFHWLEQPLVDRLYLSFDTYSGFLRREPYNYEAFRTVNITRLTYDIPPLGPIKITPFTEGQFTWYSEQIVADESIGGLSGKLGITLQTRLTKVYDGILGFSAIKHIFVPSFTLSYRTPSTFDIEDRYYFDPLDTLTGQTRLETKIDNIFYGKDAETHEIWQIARLTFYQGNDFWNELHKSDDYEIDIEIRPRSWYGLQLVGEKHVSGDIDWLQRIRGIDRLELQEWLDSRLERDRSKLPYYDRMDLISGDYTRILALLSFRNSPGFEKFNGRIGFALAKTEGAVFNRDIIYGLGYRLTDKWSMAFEHIYDLENNDLRRQSYEIRRNLHCWDIGFRWTERERGTDISIEFSLTAFPGTKIRF